MSIEESIYSLARSNAVPQAEESIYGLLPQEQVQREKATMYRSKYPHNTPPTASTFGPSSVAQVPVTNVAGSYQQLPRNHLYKQQGGTLGPKQDHRSFPTNFLRKHQNPQLNPPTKFQYPESLQERKPNLIKRAEAKQSIQQLKSTTAERHPPRNFITENALAVIMAQAKKPYSKEIDYLHKTDYGKVPDYLHEVKDEIENEKKYIRTLLAKQTQRVPQLEPKMKLLPEEERVKLVAELKLKWEQVNKDYQTLTHHVTLDSTGKIKRKEHYEQQLALLEKSIEKLSKKLVFVKDE